MITISPIPRAGLLVVHHPTERQVRQWTGTGAPQWVDLATATFADCAVALEQVGTTSLYAATLDLPDDATYPMMLYGTDATAFSDQVIAQMTWYPEPATSQAVSDLAGAVDGIGGNGDGDTPVDHNWAGSFTVNGGESQEGGDDSLLITSSQGAVDGATIRAYVAGDYDAGTRTVNAQTSTGSDGRWVAPLMLDPDDYVIVISKSGVMVTTLIRLTVE